MLITVTQWSLLSRQWVPIAGTAESVPFCWKSVWGHSALVVSTMPPLGFLPPNVWEWYPFVVFRVKRGGRGKGRGTLINQLL